MNNNFLSKLTQSSMGKLYLPVWGNGCIIQTNSR